MKNLKILFTALLLLCCVGMAKAHDFVAGGIYYNISSSTNKTVGVTYGGDYSSDYDNEYTGSVVIPESVTYNGKTYSVTSIGYSAFYGCTGLTSIEIPNSVRSIGSYAFIGCTGLTAVHISDLAAWCGINFTNAYDNPLYYAKNLYLNGEKLTELVIPDGFVEIKDYTFYNCNNLTSVVIPNSVTGIGASAFKGCNNIEKLYIGSSVESIGSKAFAGCEKINEIKVALEKPIRGSADIFADAVYDNATLYIPNGTEQLYQKREPWNLFFYIAEMDFTGIDDMEAEGERVQTIYDLQGRKVEVPSEGLYIINGKKVVVK